MLGLTKQEIPSLPLSGAALEIGTGQFMAHAAGLYVCGFDRVVTVDRYRQVSLPLVRASMERPVLARRFLSPFVSHDAFVQRWRRLEATGFSPAEWESVGIHYRAPVEASALATESGRFDLIFSYTVLEHVPPAELSPLLGGMAGLLAPGGVMLHFIDLEDHLDPRRNPFEFLSPAARWSDQQCGARGNRLRFSEWHRLLNASTGLSWSFPYAPIRHDAPVPEVVDPTVVHSGEEDLRTSALVAVAQQNR